MEHLCGTVSGQIRWHYCVLAQPHHQAPCHSLHQASCCCLGYCYGSTYLAHCAVYADKDYIKRRIIWDSISLLLDVEIPAIVGGNFNYILSQDNQRGGKPFTPTEVHNEFVSFLANNDLHDGWNGRQHYSWCKNKKGKARMWVRLDRVCFNSAALSALPGSAVTHLTRIGSDHCPLLVQGRKLSLNRRATS
ncbi:hypothetical protein AXF42_Ash019754 [Apostasia shenzhenica]|uniref:Endonuclease/exonuclease/phosphatase domain-containing protein n=1 Tax=Apostasia shenzhenica TaxID=1088818 RepID=A0A2H9ZRS3_9ASPA|nr:hypothetical protein AXF42_Ash019754 [Apostasia shenzhenica]